VESVQSYTWALCTLCKDVTRSNFHLVSLSLPVLSELIHHSDETVLLDICWVLQHLSNDRSVTRIQTILDALNNTGVRRLVALLEHTYFMVHITAVAILRNLSWGGTYCQLLIDNNLLPCLSTFLLVDSSKCWPEHTIDDVCWIFSHISLVGSAHLNQLLIGNGIIPRLMRLLNNASSPGTTRRFLRAISNMILHGSMEQIKYLVNRGCVTPLLSYLKKDPNVEKDLLFVFERVSLLARKE